MMTNQKTKEVLITRVFNATRDVVFKAWTNPAMLEKWYAPQGCKIRFKSIDIKNGGIIHSSITIPDGKECWCIGKYLEIVENEKLVYTMAVSDEEGKMISSVEAGMNPEWPDETIVTVTFEDFEDKTRLTLFQTVSEVLAKETGAYPSWLSMFDILEQNL